uniref:Signal recognition particle 54 kDa protein n=1 Tax=Phaeomonas parva TaxID=124430 RepID=A0A7S1TR72_9STRA|mmetsp:Transcript_14148/g.42303  ORF Transcript_14148/g.42303 Transcript_14148/m.42303 type:complete len:511 (+) Transcript_14148:342-1874(+)
MVLGELGSKITNALHRLQASTIVDEEVLTTMLADISRALLEADVNVRLVGEFREKVKIKVNLADSAAGMNRRKVIQRAVFEELTSMLDAGVVPYKPRKGRPNVIMFVGLQGSGKTTTVAKVAHFYQRKGWRTAMVCADTFRAGAFDQLKQNATKLRCPFYGSYTEADPVRIAEEGVAQFRADNYEIIIVDTSGRHRQEDALFEEMQEIRAAVEPDHIILVVDGTQGQAVFAQASAFNDSVDVGAVVLTKLDGHAKGGGALGAVAATSSPIQFLGTGEHFDDLDIFVPSSFVSRLLGMGDVRGLMEELKEVVDEEKQEELAERFSKGQFTLRDMYEQFQSVMKLGPIGKVMGMLPGMPSHLLGGGGPGGDQSTERVKRFMTMMDSMTDAELDGQMDKDLENSPSRIERIAYGSGSHPLEVQMLLRTHKQFEGVVKKMGKSSLMRGNDEQLAKQMARNPKQVLGQISKAMNPRMLAQMGGAQNVMQMMKEMSKMDGGGGPGGMPDLQGMFGM